MTTDLHLHTTASDGRLTPVELVDWAKSKGLELISITDHDTVDGLEDGMRRAKELGVGFVKGIELSAYSICDVHVLGYNFDTCVEFFEELEAVKGLRKERNIKIGQKLSSLGVKLDIDFSSNGLGRMNIAREMVAEGYVKDIGEAFDKYLATGAKAYVESKRITPIAAVKLIKKYGGFASVAHPKKFLTEKRLELIISGLKPYGLDGLEVYYPGHSQADVTELARIAKKYRLTPTGGSDFHGDEDKNFSVWFDSSILKALNVRL